MSSEIPESFLYSEEHEWFDPESGWVGITDYAQQQLGDIVFVDLPDVETEVSVDDDFMIVESVKSVSDIYAPVSGTISDVNSDLESSPAKVNESPYDGGRLAQFDHEGDTDGLMTAGEYESFVG